MKELMTYTAAELLEREDLTVTKDHFTMWVTYIDATPKTVQTYTRAVKQFYLFLNRNGITSPTTEDVVAFRKELEDAEKSPATIALYLQSVKTFFRWTAQKGYYKNIADHVKSGCGSQDEAFKKDYLTTRQATHFLNTIDRTTLKGKRDFAICSLMITTGLRTVEVMRADVKDLRVKGDFLVLYIQGKGHKSKDAFVKIAEPVEDAIREYFKARGKMALEDPLFASVANRDAGKRMTTRSLSRIAKEHLIEAGINSDRVTAHSLRHTAATLNLLNGGSLEETQQLLRHKNINTTMIYEHSLERDKNNSEARVASAIFG